MNKFLELEKRFEKIMKGIEKLPLEQSKGIATSQRNEFVSDHISSKDEISKLSNKIKELERDAKLDSDQIDNLIIKLQSLLENKDD